MSTVTTINTIEQDVLNYMTPIKTLQSNFQGVLANTSLTPLGKALALGAVAAQGSQAFPNQEVEAIGGLAGIVDALISGFLPASATTKTTTTPTTTTTTATPAPTAPATDTTLQNASLAQLQAAQAAIAAQIANMTPTTAAGVPPNSTAAPVTAPVAAPVAHVSTPVTTAAEAPAKKESFLGELFHHEPKTSGAAPVAATSPTAVAK